MNSSLACLSNCTNLTNYFLRDAYVDHVNTDNALGWKGECAESYAKLLKEIWSGKYKAVAPKDFKEVVGRYKERFSGYQQQDSSELLNEVLDGLHEDLNLVKKKQATSKPEGLGRPDNVVAAETWAVDELRNRSFVRDEFMGQLRSHVQCPECSKESVTFDTSLSLSLQLPPQRNSSQAVCLVRAAAEAAVSDAIVSKYSVQVDKTEGMMALKRLLVEQAADVSPQNLVVADVFYNRIYNYLSDDKLISVIMPRDTIYAFQVPLDAYVRSPLHPGPVPVAPALAAPEGPQQSLAVSPQSPMCTDDRCLHYRVNRAV